MWWFVDIVKRAQLLLWAWYTAILNFIFMVKSGCYLPLLALGHRPRGIATTHPIIIQATREHHPPWISEGAGGMHSVHALTSDGSVRPSFRH